MMPAHEFWGDRDAGWVEAIIEIPRGSRNKYEYDHERGVFRLDRVLYSSVHYPTDYGFVPGTLSGDGDPLDVLVVVDEPTFPGCHVRVRPIGTLTMYDEKGMDEKILAVPEDDPRDKEIRDLPDLAEHVPREIAAFFRTYKELQGVQTDVRDWSDAKAAWKIIEECRDRFEQHRFMTDDYAGQRVDATNARASCARGSHSSDDVGARASHSFITRPSRRGSKRSPSPEATSASTRWRGNLTTSRPCESMAKILPRTLSASDPKPLPDCSTSLSPRNSSTSAA